MIIPPPNSSEFVFFNIHIHYYSICIFLGLLAAFYALLTAIKRLNLSVCKDVIWDFTPMVLIWGIIGARTYYCLLSFNYFIHHPKEIFMFWEGGISIHGAILFGILYGIYYFKKNKLSFFKYADLYALVLPLGQAIGRFGNYFNQEAFGTPVQNSLIKLYVTEKFRPKGYEQYSYFHPTFLYESILDLLIFLTLLFIMKKTATKNYSGLIFFSYILLYSIVRLIIEFIRLDTVLYLFKIPFPSFISIILIIFSSVGLFLLFRKLSYNH